MIEHRPCVQDLRTHEMQHSKPGVGTRHNPEDFAPVTTLHEWLSTAVIFEVCRAQPLGASHSNKKLETPRLTH